MHRKLVTGAVCGASIAIAATVSLSFHDAGAAETVSFLVAGKTSNYRIADDAAPRLLNYHFFAEIFLNPGGAVANPSLTTPAKRILPFSGDGAVLEAHGGRYQTAAALSAAFPDGDYNIRYDGLNHKLHLQEDADHRLPAPVRITLTQNGHVVAPKAVQSGQDLIISWSPFKNGAGDPNDIVDDLIFVVFGDCDGNKLLHSGAPFTGKPYLTYKAESITVPAALVGARGTYQVSVEQASLRTAMSHNVPTLATFASTSFLDLATDGAVLRQDCKPVDKGQTDRYDGWKEIP